MAEINDTTISYDSYRRPLIFVLLLIVDIPGIVCNLFILTFFCSHWQSMITKAIRHHATFLLIVVSFLYTTFDLPFTMNYVRLGYHTYRSISFCLWWYWFDYSLLAIGVAVTATASIQRHILIFNASWLKVSKRRWTLHYIPLIISVVYPPLFYIVIMFLNPCTIYFDYSLGWCAYPCYIDQNFLYNIDTIFTTLLPSIIIVLANISLIIRVVRSMKRIRQKHTRIWKRQKKLTLQLLAFSSIYVIAYLPTTTVALLRRIALPNLYDETSDLYNIFRMIYFVCPIQSFICIFALPELMDFIKCKAKRLWSGSPNVPATIVQAASSSLRR